MYLSDADVHMLHLIIFLPACSELQLMFKCSDEPKKEKQYTHKKY